MVFLSILLGIVLIFASVLLLPSFLPMFFEQRELQRFIKLEDENYKKLKIDQTVKEVKSLNGRLASIKSFIQTSSQTSMLIEEIKQMAGPNISIRQINLSDGGAVSISGTALGRKELLLFEDELKKSGHFDKISSPLSDIIRGAASFTIQGLLRVK